MKIKRAKPFAANRASISLMEEAGWTCFTVEQTIPHTFIKRDCFGFGDILAISPTRGIMMVQATGGGHSANRAAKIRQEPRAAIWLAAGGRISVMDWVKIKGQKERQCNILEIEKL